MTHWSDGVARILAADSGNLLELARLAGVDPTNLYTNQSLAGCDLRGQDLRGLNLDGCEIDRAILDGATRIDPAFDPRFQYDHDDYLYFSISKDINTAILNFMNETGYRYAAWAHKSLFERGVRQIKLKRFHFYHDIIKGNRFLVSALNVKSSQKIDIRILLYSSGIRNLTDLLDQRLDEKDLRIIILVGLLCRKIRYLDDKDFSDVPINVFYPHRLIKVDEIIPTLVGEF